MFSFSVFIEKLFFTDFFFPYRTDLKLTLKHSVIFIKVQWSGLVLVHDECYFTTGNHIFFSCNNNPPRLVLRYNHGVTRRSRCLMDVFFFFTRWRYQSHGIFSPHSSHMNDITIFSCSRIINLKKKIILSFTEAFYGINMIFIQVKIKFTHQTLCYRLYHGRRQNEILGEVSQLHQKKIIIKNNSVLAGLLDCSYTR